MVMDAGQIKEFDNPLSLFDNPNTIFRSMCDAAKPSREAIVRIRAGEYAHEVQEEVQAKIEMRIS
jgi:ATP-binding cassette subfamily C (CFTR/MRP) protein 1